MSIFEEVKKTVSDMDIIHTEAFALKFQKAFIKFNTIRTKFPSTTVLSEKERELLHILETRSEGNNGDTKIRDSNLQELIGKSRQTISRYLRKLEDLGYINRLSIPLKFKGDHPTMKVWKDRTIRCLRILLKNRFKWERDLKWKRDFRPDFDLGAAFDISTGRKLNIKWILDVGTVVTLMGEEIRAAWDWMPGLCQMGLLDPEQQAMFEDLRDKIEVNHEDPEATAVLGMKVKYTRAW